MASGGRVRLQPCRTAYGRIWALAAAHRGERRILMSSEIAGLKPGASTVDRTLFPRLPIDAKIFCPTNQSLSEKGNATRSRVASSNKFATTARSSASTQLRLRLPLPLSPALLHHFRNALARGGAHMAPWPRLAADTTCRTTAPATTPWSLQSSDGFVETFALSFEIIEYVLNFHASPFTLI